MKHTNDLIGPERGCVEDQPQHLARFKGFHAIHALRLALRAQPRSENMH